jgi:predicted Rossmann fold nucleotide-binding protein DprA/Smf involved in DNA uptake
MTTDRRESMSYPDDFDFDDDRSLTDERISGIVLAIVGSTQPLDPRMARTLIRMSINYFAPIRIVSGGAPGIDTMAEVAARIYTVPFKEFPPKNKRWEPEGFKDRNIQIAEACTHLIRIANRNSKTYGSGWTHDYAQKLGKKVYQVYL